MKAITTKEYQEKKKIVLDTAPIRKIVNTGDIKIKDNDVFVNNTKINFSKEGVKQFAQTLGIPDRFIKNYSDIFGEEQKNKLINHITDGLGSKNKNIMLIGSPVTKSIIDVKPPTHNYISNVSFIQLIEDTLSDNKNLLISSFNVNHKGNIKINTINPERSMNYGRNEDFFAGLNFTQSPEKGTQLSQYMLRQICSNGMFGTREEAISGFDDDVIKNLYSRVQKSAELNFMPLNFEERIKKAIETNASYSELKMLLANLPKDPIIINRFITYSDIMQDLRMRKINVKNLNDQQERNCKINCSVWDVINGITDFSSHDYGFNAKQIESQDMLFTASKILFKKNYDTENLIN